MKAKEIIDEIIRTGLGPVLKAEGFRKAARTFRHTDTSDATKIVNIQASQWGTAEDGQFTINLGVYFPVVAVLHDIYPERDSPRACDCLVQERIGSLMPIGQDFWWQVTSTSNIEQLADEIVFVWHQCAKPWLDRHSELAAAQEFVSSKYGSNFITAMFLMARGHRDEAAALVRTSISEGRDNDGRFARWAKSHNLDV